jgi:hypothetical protein
MELHKVLSQEFGAGKRTMGFSVKSLPPVVIVTAYAEDPDVMRWQHGESVVGVVQKPFAHEKLGRIVNDLAQSRDGSGVCPSREEVPANAERCHHSAAASGFGAPAVSAPPRRRVHQEGVVSP